MSRLPPVMACIALTSRPSGSVIERMMTTVSATPSRLVRMMTAVAVERAAWAWSSACWRCAWASRAHLCDQLAQPLIHGRDVLSRHRHQSVAGDAIAVRVGLDRLQRLRHQGIDLGSDLAHRARIVRFEQVELPLERRPRLRRLLLRPDQQAHGQIREPVLQIPERLVGAIRGFHQRQRFALLHERGGVLVQLAREIEARAHQHAQQHHREQHKTREDRQPAHPACTSIVADDGGAAQRNRVMLITPPRSPSLPPSLGYPVMSISPLGSPWQVRQPAV